MNRVRILVLAVIASLGTAAFAYPVFAVTVSNDTILTINDAGGNAQTMTLQSGSRFNTLTTVSNKFTFLLTSGHTITLTNGARSVIENTKEVPTTCSDTQSSLTYTATATSTIEIQLKGVACSGGGSGGGQASSSGGSSSSSSSGSTSTSITPPLVITPAPVVTPPPVVALVPNVDAPLLAPSPASIVALPTQELSVGSSHGDVRLLQELLARDSTIYPSGKVTGYYGALTRAAVVAFQKKYGISPVGRVGPQTLAKLSEVFGGAQEPVLTPAPTVIGSLTRDLAFGSTGDDVRTLQQFLARDSAIYPEGIVSGYFGALTRAAVKKYQTAKGISPVGRVGPATRASINAELAQ